MPASTVRFSTPHASGSPLTARVSSVLSQDVVLSAEVHASATSPAPVAAFVNPSAGGVAGARRVECLVLVDTQGAGLQVCHVTHASDTEGGFTLQPVAPAASSTELAAGTTFANTSAQAVCGFYTDAQGLHTMTLGASAWGSPSTVTSSAVHGLGVATAPAGRLIAYAASATGDLIVAAQNQPGGPFEITSYAMSGALAASSFSLCMTSDAQWALLAAPGGTPTLYQGNIGAPSSLTSQAVGALPAGVSVRQVAAGYYSSTGRSIFLVVGSDGQLYTLGLGQAAASAVPTGWPGKSDGVAAAVVQVAAGGNLNMYLVDQQTQLWVLHQSPSTPWNADGTPNWAPWLPLTGGIASFATDLTPTDSPSLFTVDDADGGLQLWRRDAKTTRWWRRPVLTPATTAYEITRFRTEFAIVDATGTPAAKQPFELSLADGASACDVVIAGKTHALSAGQTLSVQSDVTGRVTVSILTTASLAAPNLQLSGTRLAATTAQPSGPVHAYLAGQGTLNPANPGGPLPQFDSQGNTLLAAQVNGKPLAGGVQGDPTLAATAAQAIGHTAALGGGSTSSGTYNFALQQTDAQVAGRPPEAIEMVTTGAAARAAPPGGLWGDLGDFLGDVWEGIKNGVTKLVSGVIDLGKGLVSLVVQIGDQIQQLANLVVTGLEDAAHLIAGVFQAIAADIADVVDWLKALFDFTAIWQTKEVIQQAVTTFPEVMRTVLAQWKTVSDAWFAAESAAVTGYFEQAIAKLSGSSVGGQSGFSNSSTPPAGQSGPVQQNSVHSNWLTDKVSVYAPTSGAVSASSDLESAASDLQHGFSTAVQDLENAMSDFWGFLTSAISDPSQFGSVALPKLLAAVEELVKAVLAVMQAVCDALLDLGMAGADLIGDVLNAELGSGPVQALWAYLASKANSSDTKLTPLSLTSLLIAFPVTVLYKVLHGSDAQPYATAPFANLAAQASALYLPAAPGATRARMTAPAPRTEATMLFVQARSSGQAAAVASGASAASPSAVVSDICTVAGIGAIMSGLLQYISDLEGPSAPDWVGKASLVFLLLNLAELTAIHWNLVDAALDDPGVQGVILIASLIGMFGVMNYMCGGFVTLRNIPKQTMYNLFKQVGVGVGVLSLGYGVYQIIEGSLTALETTYSLIGPIPNILGYMNQTSLRNPDTTFWVSLINMLLNCSSGACKFVSLADAAGGN